MSRLDDKEQLVPFCALKGEVMGVGGDRPHGVFQWDPGICAHIYCICTTPNTHHHSARMVQEKHHLVSRIRKNETQPRWTLPHGHVINIALPEWLCSTSGVLVPRQNTASRKVRRLRQEHFDGSQQTLWLAYSSTMKFEAPSPLPLQPRTLLAKTGMKYSICFLCQRHAYWKHSHAALPAGALGQAIHL